MYLRKMNGDNIVNIPIVLYWGLKRKGFLDCCLVYLKGVHMILTNKLSARHGPQWAIRIKIIRIGIRYYLDLPNEYIKALKIAHGDTLMFDMTCDGEVSIIKFAPDSDLDELLPDKSFSAQRIAYRHWWGIDYEPQHMIYFEKSETEFDWSLGMENFYIPILKQLNYDVNKTQYRIEQCSGFSGDTMHSGLKYIVEQAGAHPNIGFNAHLLILSDRLYGPAVGLHYFLWKCTDASVSVAFNIAEALESSDNENPDYLIIAGYQHDERNYGIISALREKENPPQIIMWAKTDQLIRGLCRRYQITHVFDRWKPVDEFVEFLKPLPSNKIQGDSQ